MNDMTEVPVFEPKEEAITGILEDALRAYPKDVFSDPTDKERKKVKRWFPWFQEKCAAAMGRHMNELITKPALEYIRELESEVAKLKEELASKK